MREKIAKLLRLLFQSLVEHISKTIVVGLLALIPLSLTIEYVRDRIWSPPIQWLTTVVIVGQVQLRIGHLIVIPLIIGSAIFLGYHIGKSARYKPNYFFVNYGKLKWKADKVTGSLDYPPYCQKHQVWLVKLHRGLFCPRCNKVVFKDISDSMIDRFRQSAESIARAKAQRHLR